MYPRIYQKSIYQCPVTYVFSYNILYLFDAQKQIEEKYFSFILLNGFSIFIEFARMKGVHNVCWDGRAICCADIHSKPTFAVEKHASMLNRTTSSHAQKNLQQSTHYVGNLR